jgi:hypothetical protein
VFYKSASYSGDAQVVKVHLDDDLMPYYTILVDGKEKQTDDAHLSVSKSPAREEAEKLISTLSESQLERAVAFLRTLHVGSAPAATVPSSQTPTTPAKPDLGTSAAPSAAGAAGGWNGGIPSPTPGVPPSNLAPAHPPNQQHLQHQPQQQPLQQQQSQPPATSASQVSV